MEKSLICWSVINCLTPPSQARAHYVHLSMSGWRSRCQALITIMVLIQALLLIAYAIQACILCHLTTNKTPIGLDNFCFFSSSF